MVKNRIILVGFSRIARYILSTTSAETTCRVVGLWDVFPESVGQDFYGVRVTALQSVVSAAAPEDFDYIIVTALRDISSVNAGLDKLPPSIKAKVVFLSDPLALKIFSEDADFHSRLAKYQDDLREYERLAGVRLDKLTLYPMLFNWDAPAGTSSHQYFYQDLWAASKIVKTLARNQHHWDIGSRIDGFILALLPHLQVTLIDIRPLEHSVENLTFKQADATTLAGIEDRSIPSLSSLCAVEHFGLGGYGGKINPQGDRDVFTSMDRVLSPGGHLYLSVPIGKDAVAFNAHRVYAPSTFVSHFPNFTLAEFSVAGPHQAGKISIEYHADMDDYEDMDDSCLDARYFGLFELTKNQ